MWHSVHSLLPRKYKYMRDTFNYSVLVLVSVSGDDLELDYFMARYYYETNSWKEQLSNRQLYPEFWSYIPTEMAKPVIDGD